jgi:hypothetical protein
VRRGDLWQGCESKPGRNAQACGGASAVIGIDDLLDSGHVIRWKPTANRMLSNGFLVRSDIDAVDLVVGHTAVDPLNVWPELAQHRA